MTSRFIPFKTDISGYKIPTQLNYPFYYTPDPLSLIAAEELQDYLLTQKEWNHNFGLDPDKGGMPIGKMFGVMVVKSTSGELGYLAAFSGKLSEGNSWPHFVPSIYYMLDAEGIYKTREEVINVINRRIAVLENDPTIAIAKEQLSSTKADAQEQLLYERVKLKLNKKKRQEQRKSAHQKLDAQSYNQLLADYKNESLKQQWLYKYIKRRWQERITLAEANVEAVVKELESLKIERKQKSHKLQEWLFDQYQFLNANGEIEAVKVLFKDHPLKRPPSGAGDCAAPKLFQHAYKHNLKPIAIAEFWWGASPSSKIRKHKIFYPACKGKCGPILEHMLQGLNVEDNPLISDKGTEKEIEILYEDEEIAVINKPHEFLSVPGKSDLESVAGRMKKRFPTASGPLVIHRLDMSTSGIMLIAKNPKAHGFIQKQFINRTVKKRYCAVLDGQLDTGNGAIDLPLMLDFYDRPKQMVSYEEGKQAITKYQIIDRKDHTTRILFYPLTGRTHQLRVHAAHKDGLNMPIIGDDLYGTKADRLHLHAEWIQFIHPSTREQMEILCEPPF